MNIAKANAIPLSEILKKMGHSPSSTRQNDLWFYSPFRNEKTPSFVVNLSKNVWYDHGEGMGGNAIGLICTYLERDNRSHTASDALRWLSEHAPDIKPLPRAPIQIAPPVLSFILQRVSALQTKYLIDYVKDRGINVSIAKRYLREVDFHHSASRKTFKAIGLRNVDNGLELRNRAFKGSIGPKDISFIRGSETSGAVVHVFEGMFDYLSALLYEEGKRFKEDVIILNSVSNIKRAFPYIENHTYSEIHTWFDNDRAGEKARAVIEEFAAKTGMKVRPQNSIYAPHKDVNAWHLANLEP